MECCGRLLFLLAVAVPLLLVLAPAPSHSAACPSSCDCPSDDSLPVKCTSYLPEVAWLNNRSHCRELWLDQIDQPLLESSQSSFHSDKLEAISLTRYTWPVNETDALDVLAKFVSRLPTLKYLNVSHTDMTSINWCGAISGLNITGFNASYNKISHVALDAFRGMSQLTELVLTNNLLTHVPTALSRLRKLQLLDLSDNKIYEVDATLNNMPELRRLNLAGNKIWMLHGDSFRDPRSLVELDISRNAFRFIHPESLHSFTSLSLLNLSENRLIERDLSLLLDSLRRLEVVDASRIGLWRVPATLTRSVKIMRLVGNQLTAINSGDFDSYPLLKFLDMSGNKLIVIEDDALGRLDDLQQLILYGNLLSSVPKSLPCNLKILDLRQNSIATVSANDMHGLSQLEKLDLSGNVVSSIENGAFRHLTALHELDISDNPIKRLTSDALGGPQALLRLRMAGLTEFKLDENQNQDTAFPYSQPERMLDLDLSRSSSLAALFLADNATLSACKELTTLDLSNANISSIRADLQYILPELHRIVLLGNEFNCSVWNERLVRCREREYIEFSGNKERPEVTLLTKPSLHYYDAAATTTTIASQRKTTPGTKLPAVINESFKIQAKKDIDMLVKPTATPPTTTVFGSYKYAATTTDLPTTTGIATTQSTQTKMQTLEKEEEEEEKENTTPSTLTSTYFMEERPDLYTLGESKTSEPKVVNKKLPKKTTPVEDNQNSQTTTALPSTARLTSINTDKKKVLMTTTTTTMRTTTDEDVIMGSGEDKPAIIDLETDDITTTVYDEHFKTSNQMFSQFSRSKVLLANDEEQVSAEELINDRGQRNSEFFSSGAHPGMLILVGAVIGAAAALTVVLSRRATAKGREQYHRQENIALTPTTEQRW